mgnify:CR=1 FL=1
MWTQVVNEVTDTHLETAYEEIKNYLSKRMSRSSSDTPSFNYHEIDPSASGVEAVLQSHFHGNPDSGILSIDDGFISEAKQILQLTKAQIQEKLQNSHYDIRSNKTIDDFYHWRAWYHNGGEFELIHLAIRLYLDDSIRQGWAEVLSSAF